MLTVQELLEREGFDDAALLRHGFTDYMRDYEIIIGGRNGPPHTDVHKFHFVGCVEAHCETSVQPKIFVASLGDDFVFSGFDYPDKDDPDGFIWGVRYSNAAISYIENGERAKHWSEHTGRKMHEAMLISEAFSLRLVFADLRYAYIGNEPEVSFKKDMPLPITDKTSDGGVV